MIDLRLGDCLEILPTLADASVDAIVCDPPYPCIDRKYGRMTESDWHEMMRSVVSESRRVLKPSGSAVFVLQPNYETPGRMRLWLWEFIVWAGREWNLVQDAYWWNFTAVPASGCRRDIGLMRSSVKACVWLGPIGCYRDQDAVLWSESKYNEMQRKSHRANVGRKPTTSGKPNNKYTMGLAALERGGVTPFNLIPVESASRIGPGYVQHGAATPLGLCDYWVRYISPRGGVVLDPFIGSGTTGVACTNNGRNFVGIEKDATNFQMAESRIAAAQADAGSRLAFA